MSAHSKAGRWRRGAVVDVVLGASCDGVSLTGEPDAPHCGEKRDYGLRLRVAVDADDEGSGEEPGGRNHGAEEITIDLRTHEVDVL